MQKELISYRWTNYIRRFFSFLLSYNFFSVFNLNTEDFDLQRQWYCRENCLSEDYKLIMSENKKMNDIDTRNLWGVIKTIVFINFLNEVSKEVGFFSLIFGDNRTTMWSMYLLIMFCVVWEEWMILLVLSNGCLSQKINSFFQWNALSTVNNILCFFWFSSYLSFFFFF